MQSPPPRAAIALGTLFLLCASVGCVRSFYRKSADHEVARAIAEKAEKLNAPDLPQQINVVAGPESRLFDAFDLDHPPMPPDDPLAHELMVKVDGKKGASAWRQPANPAAVQSASWREFLPRDKNGTVALDLKGAVRTAIVNSRDYQQEREDLYLSALDVTFERFRFSPQFALNSNGEGATVGERRGAVRPRAVQDATVVTDGSVRWLAATGGELFASIANTLVWNWDGNTMTRAASSVLDFSIVQPLLRFGGREQILERLTESERRLLANVRQMAQWQEGYYVRIAAGRNSGEGPSRSISPGSTGLGLIAGNPAPRTGAPAAGGFMGLLEQQQRIRNLESNVARLRQSLDQLEAAFDAGRIPSRLQVDQARQALFNGQSSLLTTRAAYQTQLDGYKIDLGLPPDLPVAVQDTLLDRFNTADPGATALDEKFTTVRSELRDPARIPDMAALRRQLAALRALEQPLEWQLKSARHDTARLRKVVPERQEQMRLMQSRGDLGELSVETARLDPGALSVKTQQIEERLDRSAKELQESLVTLQAFEAELPNLELDAARARLSEIASDLSGLLLALSLDQTATRLESAVLPPIDLDEAAALTIAREHRLDWRNARARLVDAWRKVGYFANPLKSNVSIAFTGSMGTLGTRDGDPFSFDGRAGQLGMGLRIDTPLNRLAERNNYREALIDYQQARREYMLFEDRVSQSLRNTLRIVQLSQVNFELRRSAVQVAIAQVDLARLRLAEPPRPGA
ncbi:MAG: TolC family protein, partial [Chthoniobacteraceae bacterium]